MLREGRLSFDANRLLVIAAATLMMMPPGCVEPPTSAVDSHTGDASVDEDEERRARVLINEPYPIAVTGREYQWEIRYPGPDSVLETGDDLFSVRHLHVPLDTDVVLRLRSADYIYTLAFPEYGLKEIAVPNLEFQIHLRAQDVGRFELRGDQMCGYSHPHLLGQIIVQPRAEFAEWVADRATEAPPAAASSSATAE